MIRSERFNLEHIEVNGQSVLNIMRGLKYFEPLAVRILAEQGISDPQPNAWYPVEKNLAMLETVQSRYGESTLRLIGLQVASGSVFPPDIETWIDALNMADTGYRMNHQGEGELGFYRFELTGQFSGKMICDNPYPREFNIGIVMGLCEKYCPNGYQPIVEFAPNNPSDLSYDYAISVDFQKLEAKPTGFSSEAEVLLTKKSLDETFQALLYDNEKLQKAEKEAFDSNLKLTGLYELSPIGIALTDMDGKYLEFNEAFRKICGYEKDELNKLDYWQLTPEKYKEEEAQQLASLEATGFYGPYEKEYVQKNGALIDIRLNGMLITDSNNRQFIWSLVEDIREQKEHQKQLEALAHFDPLTKLPNRTLLAKRFNEAIAHADRTNTLLAVCFLDLDDFKPLNDKKGHSVGDELLVSLSEKLQGFLREKDTIARLGGDEFVILLGDIEDHESLNVSATRILEQVVNVSLQASEVISGSLGVTLYPIDNSDPDTLIRHADNAMYQAKIRGKNRFHIFDMALDAEQVQRHKLVADISEAIKSNSLELYYQPKLNTKTGQVFGFEGLIRWNRDHKSIIFPDEFLPYITNSDAEVALDLWVLQSAFAQLIEWNKVQMNVHISINICGRSLIDSRFVDRLMTLLTQNPELDASLVQIEILESSALNELNKVKHSLMRIQDAGVGIALDDFGTGYSSLSYLRDLHAHTLKIDRSFVTDMKFDENDYEIVKGIIGLAKVFELEVIAEGVEDAEIAKELCQLGCHQLQGYWVAKPMRVTEVASFMANWKVEKATKCKLDS